MEDTDSRATTPTETGSAPFLVLPGGLCIPLEGPLRVEEIRGEWYLVGQSTWERFDSPEHASRRLIELTRERDPHRLAAEAVASFFDSPP